MPNDKTKYQLIKYSGHVIIPFPEGDYPKLEDCLKEKDVECYTDNTTADDWGDVVVHVVLTKHDEYSYLGTHELELDLCTFKETEGNVQLGKNANAVAKQLPRYFARSSWRSLAEIT